MKQISLALTHYNRFDMLVESIRQVWRDPRISEIVIVDDASTDGSYLKLVEFYQDEPKVKVWLNHENVDCYRNKRGAVEACTNEWLILFDCDNVLNTEYLDRLFAYPEWNPKVIYCPDYARPHFNYTAFSGLTVTHENIAQLMQREHFATALNTANYFVHRQSYIEVWDGSVNPHTADSIFHAYNWLKAGNSMKIVDGLRYFHRVHEGSHYKNNVHKTGNFAKEVEQKLRQLR